jgi:putative Mg2+ transporter-C (MgtC) family protein
MDLFDPFQSNFWLPIGVAVLCGTIIGLERQVRGKPAGVRTSILICLSTTVFIHLGVLVNSEGADASRVLGQLVTGVGFLGAGVMMAHNGTISGVTTAAVIWILSAIGAAIGFGHHQGAIALALTTVVVLIGVEFLESSVKFLTRGAHSREGVPPERPD